MLLAIQIEVQFYQVYPWFAQQAECPAFCVLGNYLSDDTFIHSTSFCHSPDLKIGCGGANVRVQPTG